VKDLLRKYLFLLFSIYGLTLLLPSVSIGGGFEGIVWSSLIFFIMTALLRPVLKVLLFPLHVLTLSASMWIVDILLFIIWTFITPAVTVSGGIIPLVKVGLIRIGPISLVYWQSLVLGGILLRLFVKSFEWLYE
jgi:putative membrane protein